MREERAAGLEKPMKGPRGGCPRAGFSVVTVKPRDV